MNHSEGTITGHKNVKLFYQRWAEDEEPRAAVGFIHGIGGHSGQTTA